MSYDPPEDWEPPYISEDQDALDFGKWRGVPVIDVPARYLLFMEKKGWLTLSDAYRDELEQEASIDEEPG